MMIGVQGVLLYSLLLLVVVVVVLLLQLSSSKWSCYRVIVLVEVA